MSNHSRLHNPNYSGPGIWFSLHSLGAYSKSSEEKRFAISFIKNLQQNFPCGDCKGHFGSYIDTHPLEPLINDGNEESLFLWTFNFHNAVNHRLRKPIISYEDAKYIYYANSEFCMSGCTDEKDKVANNTNLLKKGKIVPKDLPGTMF